MLEQTHIINFESIHEAVLEYVELVIAYCHFVTFLNLLQTELTYVRKVG